MGRVGLLKHLDTSSLYIFTVVNVVVCIRIGLTINILGACCHIKLGSFGMFT